MYNCYFVFNVQNKIKNKITLTYCSFYFHIAKSSVVITLVNDECTSTTRIYAI